MRCIELTGEGFSAADVAEVARGGARLAFGPLALERLALERRALEAAVGAGMTIYGVSTGLGPKVTVAVPGEAAAEFSLRTVRERAHGAGEPLPAEVVRATLAARGASLAHGGSGMTPSVASLLLELCNRNVLPVVPAIGSVGASDLCQMAFVGLVVVGEGQAVIDGATLPGAEALARAGLAPARLGPKDGLALCSSSSVTVAMSALALHDTRALLEDLERAVASSFRAFAANVAVLDPRTHDARPAPGQRESAARLAAEIAARSLSGAPPARRLQDPVSFRCVPQVHGALRAALALLDEAVSAELNGSPDNPLVLSSGEVIATGNFHTAALALGLDSVRLALLGPATLAVRRVERLLGGGVSGLPLHLAPPDGGHSGLGPLLKVAHDLLAELAHLATPAPLISQIESEAEDDASGSPLSARRLRAMLPLVRDVVAIEERVAAAAAALRDAGG